MILLKSILAHFNVIKPLSAQKYLKSISESALLYRPLKAVNLPP
jgi:hypothetical protein